MTQKQTKKSKAIDLLLARGLAADAKAAEAYLLAGEVYADGARVRGKGQLLPADCLLRVRGLDMPYVSKGGLKLAGAIGDFQVDVAGRVCVDAGASTGGFTDCLIKHGAARVYAVDVGYGQLMGSLRQDQRVVNLEKTNISDEKLLSLAPAPTLGTVDLSYLSLRKGVPAFAAILGYAGELICLVKPLFETEDNEARRTGEMPDGAYAGVLRDLIRDINALPYACARSVTHSPVTGNAGTREFFLHVTLSRAAQEAPDLTDKISRAVESALALAAYEKRD